MVEGIICRGTRTIGTFVSLCALTACAVPAPLGPTGMALPPSGKSLTTFQQEDQQCRNYAAAEIGYVQPGQAGTQAAVGSSAVGTVVGAVTGAAIGAAAENPAAGAAIGAATGLVGGTAVGANNAAASEFDLQTRYNITYSQCMYSLAIRYRTRLLIMLMGIPGTDTPTMATLGTTGDGRAFLGAEYLC